jgi:beta-glucanase (GH16 family)
MGTLQKVKTIWILRMVIFCGVGLGLCSQFFPFPALSCHWQPTLTEEFNSTSDLDSHWSREYPPGGSGELQEYVPEQVSVRDGILYLQAEKRPGLGKGYVSGIIQSRDHFVQRYGYFEMRARLPQGQGLWPAFWLLPVGNNFPNEIDVMEFLGNPPDTIYTTLHWKDTQGTPLHQTEEYVSSDFTREFHVFAVDWKPDALTWYVDGVAVRKTSENIPEDPMFLLANLAVGGRWPGNPDESTKFPAEMAIDYIRVYRWTCSPPFLAGLHPGSGGW